LKEAKYADFPSKEYELRYEKAKNVMEKHEVDALIITGKENMRYFTGLIEEAWVIPNYYFMALLSRDKGATLFLRPGNENVAQSSWIEDVSFEDPPIGALLNTIKEKSLENASLGMEFGSEFHLRMGQKDFEAFKRSLPKANLVDASDIFWEIRKNKSEAEIEKLRKACRITCEALKAGFEALREGMTERKFAAIVKSTMFQRGATDISFFAVQFGEKAMWPDTYPVHNKARKGDMIYFDGGCVYDGYYCDIKRHGVVGEPSADQRKHYDIMLKFHNACIEMMRPKVLCSDIAKKWLDILTEEGMGKFAETFRNECIGHGIGVSMHERPNITINDNIPFEPNMVCCFEPRVLHEGAVTYWKAKWKYTLEDVVLITENGPERLSDMTQELWII